MTDDDLELWSAHAGKPHAIPAGACSLGDVVAEVRRLRLQLERDAQTRSGRMNLFQDGNFTLASGAKSKWKIDCDALSADDWDGLARMASEVLLPFGRVEGVPRGGVPFADALREYVTPGCPTLLIAEDVVTTGGSMERFRAGRHALGVVVFCRGQCPGWVTPLFRMESQEARWLRTLLLAHRLDPERCNQWPGGEQCALRAGHAGNCKWAGGD